MKNSTIYRSNLSNEKIAFLSEMKNKNDFKKEDEAPKVYKRHKKEKELDLLWRGFKINENEEKSPVAYFFTGFFIGAVCIGILSLFLHFGFKHSENITVNKVEQKTSEIPVDANMAVVHAVEEASKSVIPEQETYVVKSGDSMSSIVYRFYGKYDLDKIEKIKQVNNLNSAHKLSIGQQLIIPLK